MDPVTINLILSVVVGVLANYLFGAIKKWVSRSKTKDIVIKTKEGDLINIHVNENMSVEEIDSKVKAALEEKMSPRVNP